MAKICRVCNCEIVGREHSAKLCWPCADSGLNGARKASYEVKKSVKKGLLISAKKLQCADCGLPAFCYDHRDYNKPLDVAPVCRVCNRKRGSAIPLKKTL